VSGEDARAVREWYLRSLREALALLSADAETQLAAEPLRWSIDELALEFDDAYRLVPSLVSEYGVRLSENLLGRLSEIDSMLDGMSGAANAPLWTADGVRSRPEWARVRDRAAAAASQLMDETM
jgi:hypothetical protein